MIRVKSFLGPWVIRRANIGKFCKSRSIANSRILRKAGKLSKVRQKIKQGANEIQKACYAVILPVSQYFSTGPRSERVRALSFRAEKVSCARARLEKARAL